MPRTKRERKVQPPTAEETKSITISYIESVSTPGNVAAFLSNVDLLALNSCSHRLQYIFCTLFVPRTRWCFNGLAELSSKTQKLVRKLLIENDIDKVDLSSYVDVKFGGMCQNKNLKEFLSGSCGALQSIELGSGFNSPIELGTFPESLTFLKLGSFNYPLDMGVLPAGLKVLMMGRSYGHQLDSCVLPSSLEVLDLGESTCEIVSLELLPVSLISLKFAAQFDKFISIQLLPRGLTSLVMPYNFNQLLELGALPSSLTHLGLGKLFDRSFEVGVLPVTLTSLDWRGVGMDGLKPGSLPHALTRLNAKWSIHCREGMLPPNLKELSTQHLYISTLIKGQARTRLQRDCFDKEMMKRVMPASLTNLRLSSFFRVSSHGFPAGLKTLTFLEDDFECSHLPSSLTCLELGHLRHMLSPNVLPRGLIELTIGSHHHLLQLNVLPPNLLKFSCRAEIGPIVPGVFPPTLCTLMLGNFQVPLAKKSILPSGLTHLSMLNFNQPLVGLPSGLKVLNLGSDYSLPLVPGALPSGLTALYLGVGYTHELTKEVLPPGLRELRIARGQRLREVLPKSVEIVRFVGTYDLMGRETLPGIRTYD